ncbi:hypothetical protein BH09GEM1_BH09GEM1_12520 [soil metagenome]
MYKSLRSFASYTLSRPRAIPRRVLVAGMLAVLAHRAAAQSAIALDPSRSIHQLILEKWETEQGLPERGVTATTDVPFLSKPWNIGELSAKVREVLTSIVAVTQRKGT